MSGFAGMNDDVLLRHGLLNMMYVALHGGNVGSVFNTSFDFHFVVTHVKPF